MDKEVINAEVVTDVTKKGLVQTIASNPVAKYGVLVATGAITAYGGYRLVKFIVGKVKAKKAKEPVDEQPSEEQPDTAAEESKDLN